MGKTLVKVKPSTGTPVEVTISRARLTSIVNNAITKAITAFPEMEHELAPELIREAIKTTTEIDARTWQNPGSCGCPLTAAGRVYCSPEVVWPEKPSGILHKFFTTYDDLMSSEFSSQNPMRGALHATITD